MSTLCDGPGAPLCLSFSVEIFIPIRSSSIQLDSKGEHRLFQFKRIYRDNHKFVNLHGRVVWLRLLGGDAGQCCLKCIKSKD